MKILDKCRQIRDTESGRVLLYRDEVEAVLTAGDTISRKAAVAVASGYCHAANVADELRKLPSAEKPFKLPEIYVAEGFDTVEDEDGNIGFGVYVPDENQIFVAGDVEDEIRARALLHEVCHWVQDMCGRPFDEEEANEFSDIVYGALPSAQPEQRWIPVTERMPEKPNMYTVTDSKGYVVRFVFTGTENSREYWLRCAKAWMPLPEPYRAERREG